ncbi:MAG: hypothetical protein KBS95_05310 [Alistipes sp.]|nr:hypothetical protein [Candidatus Alistipes equi]
MKNFIKLILVIALTAGTVFAVEAAKKEKKAKVTDPRLLKVMKLTKSPKDTQFLAAGEQLKTSHRAGRGFDVTSNDEELWYAQPGNVGKGQPGLTKIHETYIIRKKNGKREYMTLRYFGGCDNITIEKAADGDYVWIGSHGDKWAKKSHYYRTRAISRFKFEPGTEINDGYAGETYYLGGASTARYMTCAVKPEEDILAVTTSNSGAVTINIYSLQEARALPDVELKVKTHWKGENVGEEEEYVVRRFKGKDLTSLDAKASFVVEKKSKENDGNPTKDPNFYTFRGFDVDKDYVYFVEGQHNKGKYTEEGPSKAFITVFDYAGRVVLEKRRIQAVAEKMLLANMGITTTGYADIFGFKIKGEDAYIGFSSYGPNKKGKNVHKAVVIKY